MSNAVLDSDQRFDVGGRQVEIVGEFEVGKAEFGLSMFDQGTLTYNPLNGLLTLDLTSVNRVSNDGWAFDGMYQSQLPKLIKEGETMKMHVYIDHSILDIFINDTWAASVRVFPTDASADGLGVISRGTTQVKQLSVYELDPKHQAGIGCIVNDDACQSTDDAYYNMLGCKVASPTSGVYIHRGHKVYR